MITYVEVSLIFMASSPQFQSQPAFRQNSEASYASLAKWCWLATLPIAPVESQEME